MVRVPDELKARQFTVDQARQLGLDRWHLKGASWKRVGHGTYSWKGLPDTILERLRTAAARLPAGSGFSGLTAAWLHGIDVLPEPLEVTVPPGAGVSARSGLIVRRSSLAGELVQIKGLMATSIVRTIAGICTRLSLTEAVVVADAALHNRHIRLEELVRWADAHPGRQGVRRLRRVIEHAEVKTESPMESRLRMLLVLSRLPRPAAQVSIRDGSGHIVGRPDLYYEAQRLGIEYDGDVHRGTLAQDNRRQNMLLGAGVRLLRFTAADVFGRPDSVVAQVRATLRNVHLPAIER